MKRLILLDPELPALNFLSVHHRSKLIIVIQQNVHKKKNVKAIPGNTKSCQQAEVKLVENLQNSRRTDL